MVETLEDTRDPMSEAIAEMLDAQTWVVVGASTNPEKYGNRVYKSLLRAGRTALPVNPRAAEIDGAPCYPSVAAAATALGQTPDAAVAIIPPALTEQLIDELAALGITHLWMQPGAESPEAVRKADAAHIASAHGGPCILQLEKRFKATVTNRLRYKSNRTGHEFRQEDTTS